MIISYPNVIFRWHNPRVGICGIEDYIKDFSEGRYGYELKAGQCVYMIKYHFEHHACYIYHAEIGEVTTEGITVTDWMEKGWHTDMAEAYRLVTNGVAFFPWKFKDADLEIEPCESLYGNYKAKDLLNGTARDEITTLVAGKTIPDGRGKGIFYQHGGWRTTASKYKDNLKNIVKLGQMELDLNV